MKEKKFNVPLSDAPSSRAGSNGQAWNDYFLKPQDKAFKIEGDSGRKETVISIPRGKSANYKNTYKRQKQGGFINTTPQGLGAGGAKQADKPRAQEKTVKRKAAAPQGPRDIAAQPRTSRTQQPRSVQQVQGSQQQRSMQQQAKQQAGRYRTGKRRKKMYKGLRNTALVLLLIFAAVAATFFTLFRIKTFRVDGQTVYTQEQIVEAFGNNVGSGMFGFKLADKEQQMLQTLVYLDAVEIRRSLPQGIVFIVSPANEKYYTMAESGYYILSQNLKVMRSVADKPEGMCLIEGVLPGVNTVGQKYKTDSEEQTAALYALIEALDASGIEPVTAIDIQNTYDIKFAYDARLIITLGTNLELSYKLEFVANVIYSNLAADAHGTIDASVPGKCVYNPKWG